MVGLDLSGVQSVFEGWLLDDVEMVRTNGSADDDLDEVTGVLTPGQDPVVYDGPGAVLPLSGYTDVPDPDVQRVLATTDAKYRLLLPLGADVVPVVGDEVRVKATRSTTPDPLLTSRRFEVVELAEVSSYAVLRTVYLKQVGVTPAEEE